jgi:hypothetical protein
MHMYALLVLQWRDSSHEYINKATVEAGFDRRLYVHQMILVLNICQLC